MLCFPSRSLSLCLKCVGKTNPQRKSLQLSKLKKSTQSNHHIESCNMAMSSTVEIIFLPTKRGQWPIHRRGANSDCEGKWDKNSLLDFFLVHGKAITEVYTATMKPDKLMSCCLLSHRKDGPSFRNSNAAQTWVVKMTKLVKPKIRSSGSFKKQDIWLFH